VENAAAIRVAPALHPSAFRMARGNRSETVAHPRRATPSLIRELLIALTVPIAALC